MKITLSGSFSARRTVAEIKRELEALGHEVQTPDFEHEEARGKVDAAEDKKACMVAHIGKIEWCDAVLAVNIEKKGIANYIGGNTLIELAIAFYLKKKIFLLNPLPDLPCADEVSGMEPVILSGKLTEIR